MVLCGEPDFCWILGTGFDIFVLNNIFFFEVNTFVTSIYLEGKIHDSLGRADPDFVFFYPNFYQKKPNPPGGFPIYHVPSSRTVCTRTPLEGIVPGSLRGVLLHTVLEEET